MGRYIARLSMLACLMSVACLPASLTAGEKAGEEPPRIYGWVEKGIVVPVGALVKMKLDTGALTSSMHAEDIEFYSIDGDDSDGVRFNIELEDRNTGELVTQQLDLPVERYLVLRGAGGEERRPVVKLSVCIGDRIYHEQFSLRDRDNMLYPVLIGRRTIRDLGLVDASSSFLNAPDCGDGEFDLGQGAADTN